MAKFIESILDSVDVLLSWISSGVLKQTNESYCDIQTADSPTVLVANDGALVSVLRIDGVKALIGTEEFNYIQNGLLQGLQATMKRTGHAIQVFFNYDKSEVAEDIVNIFKNAQETAKRLSLTLDDLFKERVTYLSSYCAHEDVFMVLWTRPSVLTDEQQKQAMKDKVKFIKAQKSPSI